MIVLECQCGARLKVPETLAGKQCKCPSCGQMVAVPAASPSPPPLAPAGNLARAQATTPGMATMRMSKGFFLGSTVAMVLGGFLLRVIIAYIWPYAYFGSYRSEGPQGAAALLISLVCHLVELYILVVMMIFLYKMWKAIQDGTAPISPGRAIGFMFIPVFNMYWTLRVYWDWAKSYNAYLRRHNLTGQPVSEGLFLASAALNVVSVMAGLIWTIPYLRMASSHAEDIVFFFLIDDWISRPLMFAAGILMIAVVETVCDRVNALSRGRA